MIALQKGETLRGTYRGAAPVPTIAYFTAAWCGPCKAVGPKLEPIAARYKGAALVVKVDVDEHEKECADLEVASIPCLVVLRDGQVVDRVMAGGTSTAMLEDFVSRHVNGPAP